MTQAESRNGDALAAPPSFLPGKPNGSPDDELEETPTSSSSSTTAPPATAEPAPPSPGAESPSTSSPATPPSPGATRPESSSPSSSRASTSPLEEIPQEATNVVAKVVLPGVLALGIGANRLYQRRTGEASARWMLTDDEAQEIGGAFARILARRVPEQLVAGENGDFLVIAATAAGYVIRNALDLSEETVRAAQEEARAILEEEEAELERIRRGDEARGHPRGPVIDQGLPLADPPPQAHVAGVHVLDAGAVGAV